MTTKLIILLLASIYIGTIWLFLRRDKYKRALKGGLLFAANMSLGVLAALPLIMLKFEVSDDSGFIAVASVVFFLTYLYIAVRINSVSERK